MQAQEVARPVDERRETPRSTVWANLTLTVATAALALLLVEIGLRLYAGVPLLHFGNFIRDRVDPFSFDPRFAYDPQLGWVSRPETHTRHVHSDSYGIRLAGGVDRPLPQGAVLAVGDSFTFGEEVDGDESWPAYLEAMTGTPVVNAATGGWGTDQIVLRAEAMIGTAHPRTLIVDFLADDIARSEYRTRYGNAKPFFTVADGQLLLHNVPVPRSEATALGLGWPRAVLGYSYTAVWTADRLGFGQWLYRDHFVEFVAATPQGTGQQISCLLLKRLKQKSNAAGIRLILVMEYKYAQISQAPPSEALDVIGCAHNSDIATIDTWEPLAALVTSDPAYLRTLYVDHPETTAMGHMSAEGNRFVAGLIAQHLGFRNEAP
jgi:hypothetical protein